MIDIGKLQKISSKMSILYAEDDIDVQNNTKMIFEDLFKNIDTADDGKEALELYKQNEYDVVATDINMPNLNGIELIHEIKKINPNQVIIITSAHNETEYFIDGIKNGIFGFILKPISYEQLLEVLDKVVNIIQDRKENARHKAHLQEVVKEKIKHTVDHYKQIKKMLTKDKITELPNANLLYQYLDFHSRKNLSVCMFRLDNYDFLVQTYDTNIINNIFKNLARYIKLNMPKNGMLYKYSDEEFVATFNGDENCDLEALATQINAFLQETPILKKYDGTNLYVTLSCGIAQNEPALNILQKTKAMLNELARADIHGYFKTYDDSMKLARNMNLEKLWFEKIREIIENDHIIPYFHPIVSNETNKIEKYECLVRADDDGEIISPYAFLESIRKMGLSRNLTKIMINKCFKIFSGTDLRFTINLTYEDLLDNMFVNFILSKSQQYDIKPEQVTFEILEDIIFDDKFQTPMDQLNKLSSYGFSLALDDFGHDRSNLNRLTSELHLDMIKIDGQFIRNIDKSEKNRIIVSSIVKLAKTLGLEIVAEFVSTKEEYEVIKSMGIDFSQGYYFFKPQGYV